MTPIRRFLLLALILSAVAPARADEALDRLKQVQAAISARLPLLAEGRLTKKFQNDKDTISLNCIHYLKRGSEAGTWHYQGTNIKPDAPNFLWAPNELVDPMTPLYPLTESDGGRPPATARVVGKETIDGANYDVVETTQTADEDLSHRTIYGGGLVLKTVVRRVYIGRDGLIHRISGELSCIDSNLAAGKPEAVQKAQFVLDITSYRKAVVFPPRPYSQPVAHRYTFPRTGASFPSVYTVSRDGRLLAYVSAEGDIHLVEVATGKERTPLKGHITAVKALAFSPDGTRLISADALVAAVWNTDTGKLLYTYHDLPEIFDATFSPEGKMALLTANSSLVHVVDVETGQLIHRFDNLPWGQYTFSPDGSYLAGFIGFRVMLWNTKTWQPITVDGDNIPAGGRIAFSPDGKSFALGGHYAEVTVWETQTGRKIRELKGAAGIISAVWFSPDGQTITALDMDQRGDVSGSGPGLTTWDTATWQVTGFLTLADGGYVQLPYPGSSGSLFLLQDQLGLFDGGAQSVKFWKLPILPAQP